MYEHHPAELLQAHGSFSKTIDCILVDFMMYAISRNEFGEIMKNNNSEIYISVLRRPSPSLQEISISDKDRCVIFKEEIQELTSEYLTNLFNSLKASGVYPNTIYIEHFSGIESAIQNAWENAKVLIEYNGFGA